MAAVQNSSAAILQKNDNMIKEMSIDLETFSDVDISKWGAYSAVTDHEDTYFFFHSLIFPFFIQFQFCYFKITSNFSRYLADNLPSHVCHYGRLEFSKLSGFL